jgi:hypothetical protein
LTQAIGRRDYVLTVENFQKLSDSFLSVGWSSLDVLRKQQLGVAHGVDDQFFIGRGDETGDVHARFLPRGRLAAQHTGFQSQQRRLVPEPTRSREEFALATRALAIFQEVLGGLTPALQETRDIPAS